MHIRFEQTGGIMGRRVSLDLDTTDLLIEQVESIRQALDDANFFGLPENLVTHPAPDEMKYAITVETENIVHSVQASDTSATPALRILIQNLSQQARSHHAKKE